MVIRKKKIGDYLLDGFNYVMLFLVGVSTLYPFWHVFVASLSKGSKIDAHRGFLLWPLGFDLSSYRAAFANQMIGIGFKNTAIILVIGVPLSLLFNFLGAYFFSRSNVYWKPLFVKLLIVTMYFSGGLIPTYFVVRSLGLIDKLWSLIIPGLMSTSRMIIMRTYINGLPKELEETAEIDGAGHLTKLFVIILPLSKAIFAVMALYFSVDYWNSWSSALIYIKSRENYPLGLVLREILIEYDLSTIAASTKYGTGLKEEEVVQIARTIKYATIMISTLPIICLYPLLQKYFVKGVMIGSLKG
jgi:putative aldouronate transport system permease protein